MKMNYSKPILSLLFLLLFSFIGNAQEAERIINKSYPLASNGNLSLSNSYGNMTLNHWDKDEVKSKSPSPLKAEVKNAQKSFWRTSHLTSKLPLLVLVQKHDYPIKRVLGGKTGRSLDLKALITRLTMLFNTQNQST